MSLHYKFIGPELTPGVAITGYVGAADGVLVTVRTPAEARRGSVWIGDRLGNNGHHTQCRSEFLDVISVSGASYGVSPLGSLIEYRPGTRIYFPWAGNGFSRQTTLPEFPYGTAGLYWHFTTGEARRSFTAGREWPEL